jgi:hypothetical protein
VIEGIEILLVEDELVKRFGLVIHNRGKVGYVDFREGSSDD